MLFEAIHKFDAIFFYKNINNKKKAYHCSVWIQIKSRILYLNVYFLLLCVLFRLVLFAWISSESKCSQGSNLYQQYFYFYFSFLSTTVIQLQMSHLFSASTPLMEFHAEMQLYRCTFISQWHAWKEVGCWLAQFIFRLTWYRTVKSEIKWRL